MLFTATVIVAAVPCSTAPALRLCFHCLEQLFITVVVYLLLLLLLLLCCCCCCSCISAVVAVVAAAVLLLRHPLTWLIHYLAHWTNVAVTCSCLSITASNLLAIVPVTVCVHQSLFPLVIVAAGVGNVAIS